MNISDNKKELFILFLFYLISNIFLLINTQGVYWDDYVITNQANKTVLSIFFMAGNIVKGYIHNFLLSFENGILIYRLLVFILFFFTGVSLYFILSTLKIFKQYKLYITLLYLIAPLNFAKIALINTPAILLLFLFYLAFFIVIKYLENRNMILRIFSIFLFFISFIQNSLLVFYVLVLMYLYYQNYRMFISFYKIKQFLFKYFDFIILPILFWIIKSIYLKPHGLYENYNIIHFDIKSFLILIASFYFSFIKPILLSVVEAFNHYIVFIFFTLIISLFIMKNFLTLKINDINKNQVKIFVILGVFIFILAVFPYAMVHKLPTLDNMNSRHQILLPLGFSFLYSAILLFLYIRNKILYKIFLIFSISIFLTKTYGEYLNYQKDWFYQIAIMNRIKQNNIIKENKTFIYKLIGRENLANDRNINFYQMNGFSRIIFKNSDKLFVQSKKELIEYGKTYNKYPQYNFYKWEYTKPIKISIKLYKINEQYFYKLLFEYYFNIKKFNIDINKMVTLKILNKEVK